MSDETILTRLGGAALEVRAIHDDLVEKEDVYPESAVHTIADRLDIEVSLVRALLGLANDMVGDR